MKLNNKYIFLFSIIISFFFSLLLIPFIQNSILLLINNLFNKQIELNTLWKNRFIEHSIKCIFIILSAGCLIQFFENKDNNSTITQTSMGGGHKSAKYFCYFFICSFLILSICSTCSFLYPFHTWDDSNCFFTVGKSVWFGKVIYRDLFEQKGPLLYFIHSAAYLISKKTFIGIFLFEVIASTFFLFLCWKTISLFTNENCGLFIPLIAVIIYSSTSFKLGDSAEEFCLPFLMYSFYASIKRIKENSIFSNKELLLTGFFSGCVLWIKFSLLGFYVGWIIIPVYLYAKKKMIKEIAISANLIILGVFIATIPYIIYFGINNAIKDWFEVYLYDNIFLYTTSENGSVIKATAKGLFRFYWRNYIVFYATILSAITIVKLVYKKQKPLLFHIIFIYITMPLFIFGGGRWYEYYGFDFGLFSIFLIIPIFQAFSNFLLKKESVNKIFYLSVFSNIIIFTVLTFIITDNKEVMKIKKEELPQYKFEKIISKYKNPTLLNYGTLDCGFYTVTGIVPANKFFIRIHIPLEEMDNEQNAIVQNGSMDFIVSKIPLETDKYTLIEQADSNIRNHKYTFYLYKNKKLF